MLGVDYGKVWVDDALVLNTNFNSDDWNTSFGGGLFINVANMMTGNISAFNSDDGSTVGVQNWIRILTKQSIQIKYV